MRDVRRHLSHYGIRPQFSIWQATWTWASGEVGNGVDSNPQNGRLVASAVDQGEAAIHNISRELDRRLFDGQIDVGSNSETKQVRLGVLVVFTGEDEIEVLTQAGAGVSGLEVDLPGNRRSGPILALAPNFSNLVLMWVASMCL